MHVRQIPFGSAAYRHECALRQAVLRAPLGLELVDDDLAAECGQLHFGLYTDDGELIACAIALPRSPTEAKIRQMAVHPAHQGRGCGRILMQAVESDLAARGFTRVVLHARQRVAGFYTRLGYAAEGEPFTEVGLPHLLMKKRLAPGQG